jgi:Ser/Thr protein kinase RdoA (MazF antagonist)
MQEEVQVVTALAAGGVPVIRLATLAVPQPLVANGTYGTLWDYVPHEKRPTYQQFGRALRAFHKRADSLTIRLPDWQPLASARQRLNTVAEHYPCDDIALLEQWYERIRNMLVSLQPVLPAGVIHGQAEIGNVLVRGGQPVFLDFDVSHGVYENGISSTRP